ncbi:hypothetical protein H0H87_009561 [Tephrocybe sp. NHM501043]|nr:hypothetical protein H0H87_009561 [Tephrocybe sp. NHM501043]
MASLLQTTYLFAPNLPSRIKDHDLWSMFYGFNVTNINMSAEHEILCSTKEGWTRLRRSDSYMARIEFSDVVQAEEAFAIKNLRFIPNVSPTVTLKLFISTNLAAPPLTKPRFLTPVPSNMTDVLLYTLMRPFGRLFSVRLDPQLGGVVQFWTEEEANAAELAVREAYSHTSRIQLQTYDSNEGAMQGASSVLGCKNEDASMDFTAELGSLRAEKSNLVSLLEASNSRVRLLELQFKDGLEEAAKELKRLKEAAEHDERAKIRKDAIIAEISRCRHRDARFCQWSNSAALARFTLVVEEFENLTYSETHALTFEGIPWPILDNPLLLKSTQSDVVTWEKVEAFFGYVRGTMMVKDYRKMIEKVHRLFHPDKWHSRRFLDMVHDQELRISLERSVNIVAQALTPLWQSTKDVNTSRGVGGRSE